MTRQGIAQPLAGIDACCLIDVLASGEAEAILRAGGFIWQLPSAVQGEVLYVRQYDPAQPGQIITVPVDLTGFIASGLLTVCKPENQPELDRFIHYAAIFRSDGESMCLALAEQRGWAIATDDRRAIRIAQQAGITVVSCPQLVKAWVDAAAPEQAVLNKVLRDIHVLAQFTPNPTMPEFQWWMDQLSNVSP